MYSDAAFLEFFEIDKHIGKSEHDLLCEAWGLEDAVLGFRDIAFIGDKAFICLLGDMSLVSRLDSYLTNHKFFWETQLKELVYSVGLLDLYRLDDLIVGKCKRVKSISYNAQVICSSFDPSGQVLAIGDDDGVVFLYEIGSEPEPKMKELFNTKLHSKRVMAIRVDSAQNMLFSVGEDGFL